MFDGMRKNCTEEMCGLYFKLNRFLGEDFRNPCNYVTMMDCVKCDLGEMEEKIRAGVKSFLYDHPYRLGVCNDEDKEHFFTHVCMERIGYVLFKETLADTGLMKETYYKMKIKHGGVNLSDCVNFETLLNGTIDEIEKEIYGAVVYLCQKERKTCNVYDARYVEMYGGMCKMVEYCFYNVSIEKKIKDESL